MGYTFSPVGEKSEDAVEGVFGEHFVARRLAGEAMTELCREFGISCKTGYKNFDRYQEMRGSRIDRQEPTTVSVWPSTSFSG
jgi:hypothetical protein